MIVIRKATDSDRAFIYSTMLKGILHGTEFYTGVPRASFYAFYPSILDRLYKKQTVNISVACLADDNDIILGYAISESDTVHFVYVKEAWRTKGIAKSLLSMPEIRFYSHKTRMGYSIANKKGLTFNPFSIL